MEDNRTISDLMSCLPQVGRVEWIGIRPDRRADMTLLENVEAKAGEGLVGDRYAGRSGKREVTLIQAEHIDAIASMLHLETVRPEQLRRNIVVSGVNLLALKDKRFRIGKAVLEMTGLCHPCSRMEETFGEGGYNAVRGHGGITARVVEEGVIRVGDDLAAMAD